MGKNLKIAITGGIGSGKSLATTALKQAGYFTLSSDEIVTDLYEKNEVRKLLKDIFPTAVGSAPDYPLDRKAIAKIAFSDKEKHERLTATIPPLVLKEIERRTSEAGGVSIVEVPLLFECSYQNFFDKVIVIFREKEERIKSVIARSKLTREQVIDRMNNQVDYEKLDLTPYIVIKNDCEVDSFTNKVITTVENLDK